MGVMRPELVMKSIVPVVMAGVLGIYGLIIAVIISTGSTPPPACPPGKLIRTNQSSQAAAPVAGGHRAFTESRWPATWDTEEWIPGIAWYPAWDFVESCARVT